MSSVLLSDVLCIKIFEMFTYQLSIVTDPQCIYFILCLKVIEILKVLNLAKCIYVQWF